MDKNGKKRKVGEVLVPNAYRRTQWGRCCDLRLLQLYRAQMTT